MAKTDERSSDYGADRSDIDRTGWVTGQIDRQECKWAMFCHLSGLAGLSVLLPVIGGVVAPLIIWQLKLDEYQFVAEQGRRAVNFQLSMLLCVSIGIIVCFASIIGAFLVPAVFCIYGLVDVIFVLIAAAKANRGQHYRYPFSIRFFK
jgi:uncharacterized Tic20 family protein